MVRFRGGEEFPLGWWVERRVLPTPPPPPQRAPKQAGAGVVPLQSPGLRRRPAGESGQAAAAARRTAAAADDQPPHCTPGEEKAGRGRPTRPLLLPSPAASGGCLPRPTIVDVTAGDCALRSWVMAAGTDAAAPRERRLNPAEGSAAAGRSSSSQRPRFLAASPKQFGEGKGGSRVGGQRRKLRRAKRGGAVGQKKFPGETSPALPAAAAAGPEGGGSPFGGRNKKADLAALGFCFKRYFPSNTHSY